MTTNDQNKSAPQNDHNKPVQQTQPGMVKQGEQQQKQAETAKPDAAKPDAAKTDHAASVKPAADGAKS